MANAALATVKIGLGYGQVSPNLGVKCVVASFSAVATGDALIFDASNVGQENALSKITFAIIRQADGKSIPFSTGADNVWASNVVSVGTPIGATTVTCVAYGVGA